MADAAPRLSTVADPAGYAPYSITAILAGILAGLFLAAILILGGAALIGGQQLVEPLLLVMPAAVLVLAFAARRQIYNSEGTRVGLNLCNFAWWVGVLGGFGYAAYLVGRMVGVQQDTKDALVEWMATLQKADPIDTRNAEFHNAYKRTIDTGRQKSLEGAKSPAEIEAAQRGFHDDTPSTIGITRFRQIDLVRVLHRNRDYAPQFTFDGLQTWQQDTSGLRCKAGGTLRVPEGEFKLNFDMMRQLVDRPTWRIVAPSGGFIGSAKLTRYGQLIGEMEFIGRNMVNTAFLAAFTGLPQYRSRILSDFAVPMPSDRAMRYFARANAECAVLGVLGTVRPEPAGYETMIKSQIFAPIARADAAKEGDPREKFYAAWREGRIVPYGVILRDTPDQYPLLTFTEKSCELRVPIEIQQPRMESSQAAARGAVILVCDDPAFMARINELRKAAATEEPADVGPPVVVSENVPWKFVRIVSDMKPVSMPKKDLASDQTGF